MERTRLLPDASVAGFAFTVDLVYRGWLLAVVDDGRGERRLYASYLTPALEHLLDALVALSDGEPVARVSWDGEPTEHRWVITVDAYAHARVRVLRFDDRMARLPDHDGNTVLDADLPLRDLVGSVTSPARGLLNRLGAAEYARRWGAGPFPVDQLSVLERWFDRTSSPSPHSCGGA